MKELGYERRFRLWCERSNVTWTRVEYPRPGGGRTVGYHLRPARAARGLVVAAHGAGNDALFAFVGIFKTLLERGYQVFTFDLDGHGRGSTTRFTETQAPTAIHEAVRESRVGESGLPLHLLGVSIGGSLLLHAAQELDVASAVVIAAPLQIDLSARSFLREIRPRLLSTIWQGRRDFGLTGLIPSVGPFRRSIYPLRLGESEPGAFGYVTILNRLLAKLDLERSAAKITAPVLLVYGDRDLLAPIEHGERLNRAISRSELLTLEGETHLTAPLAPAVTAALVRWIETHGRPRSSGVQEAAEARGEVR